MHIRIPADALAEAAAYAAKSISPRPPVLVLSGLLLEAAAGQLRVSGFDYERSNRTSTAAEVTTPGNVILNGRLFTEIVRKFGRKPLTLTVNGNRATIQAGNAEFTMTTMPADDYPTMPALPATAGTIDGATLAEAVSYVTGAASTDDTLPILGGIEGRRNRGRRPRPRNPTLPTQRRPHHRRLQPRLSDMVAPHDPRRHCPARLHHRTETHPHHTRRR
jgi:DNA polymerase-3 subunit beta